MCIAVALLLVGFVAEIDFAVWLGVFAAVLGLAAVAWNLFAADREDRQGR